MTPAQQAHVAKARDEYNAGREDHARRRILAAFPGIPAEEVTKLLTPNKEEEATQRTDERIAAAAEAAMAFDDYTVAVMEIFKRMPSVRRRISTEELSAVEVHNLCIDVAEKIGYLMLCNKNPTDIFRAFFTSVLQHGFDKATGAPLLISEPDQSKNAWIRNLSCVREAASRQPIEEALTKTLGETNLTEDLIKSL